MALAKRIIEAASIVNVMTIRRLVEGTFKLRKFLNSYKKVTIIELKPVVRNKQMLIKAQAQGQAEQRLYEISVMFSGVLYSPKQSNIFPIPVDLGQGEQMFMKLLKTDNTPVQVRCSCKDYRFTWAWYNKVNHGLFGRNFPPYVRKTNWMPERNPLKVPGVCKHVLAVFDKLTKEYGMIR